jgi:predicted MPP superfamily phosphohydrolase
MYIEANRNRVNSVNAVINSLPDSFHDFQLFFISDVHRRIIHDSVIEKASTANIVIIGGDLAEKGVPIERVKENLLKLTKIAPVYFVWGNNDYELNMKELSAAINNCGVEIINNSCVSIEQGGKKIDIAGVDDLSLKKDNLEQALSDSHSPCKILISHNPDIVKKMKEKDDISLVVSGHTHGGQIRLGPFGIAKRGGWYAEGTYQLFISNGYGTRHLPLRLGAESETNLITLKQAKSLH